MLKEIDLIINDLATDYDTVEDRYFQAFKQAHGGLNMTIEEFRGSNLYNIFNSCILMDMTNNKFLTNFIPEVVNNSVVQNEINETKYSGNTAYYLRQQIRKLNNVKEVQVIDVNSDSVGTPKGNVRIFIKTNDDTQSLNPIEVGEIIYNNLNEGVVSLGDTVIDINRDGFIKNIQYSYANNSPIVLNVVASPNNSWNGDLFTNTQLVALILEQWNNYYTMQKEIQPQVFLRNLEMLANVSFSLKYKDTFYTQDFSVDNGDYLTLSLEDISLQIG
ncbi:MAG: hypothetical protein LBH40_00750 [Alphaproteobacteria bacterium]|jgi:hypothetical protein|nr:hypothetical protein [Alphaproteobacteria bacterium]